MELTYSTFLQSVRAPRIACLFDKNVEDWTSAYSDLICSFCEIWGGSGFIVVPTDGRSISPEFWAVLRAYDPDYIASWPPNRKFIDQLLLRELSSKLCPFQWGKGILVPFPKFRVEDKFPFTNIADILPFCEHPLLSHIAPTLMGVEDQWRKSVFGEFDPQFVDTLRSRTDIGFVPNDLRIGRSETFNYTASEASSLHGDRAFPFGFSRVQLSTYRFHEYYDDKEAVIAILGDTFEDLCLFLCLSRMRSRVFLLLPEWFEDLESLSGRSPDGAANLITAAISRSLHLGTKCFLYSMSHSRSGLKEFVGQIRCTEEHDIFETKLLEDELLGDVHEESDQVTKSIELALEYLTRLYETDNDHLPMTYQLLNGKTGGAIQIPKPKGFKPVPSGKLRWISDIKTPSYSPAQHSAVTGEIVNGIWGGARNSRIQKGGVAFLTYLGKDATGRDNSTEVTDFPGICLPSSEVVFRRVFNEIGLEMTRSDKGVYAFESIGKFDSIGEIADFLRSGGLGLLRKFLDDSKPISGVDDEGVPIGRRRYLDLKSIGKLLEVSNDEASEIIYNLTERSVLVRGTVLKCDKCKGTDWYNINDIGSVFTCQRCYEVQAIGRNNTRNLEPRWFYKLNEIVLLSVRNNFEVPLLAADVIRMQDTTSFHYCPEQIINDEDSEFRMEVDLLCISQGQCIIGEAKSGDSVSKKSIKKYFWLAKKAGIHQVVFATSAEKWKKSVKEQVQEQSSISGVGSQILERDDLFAS